MKNLWRNYVLPGYLNSIGKNKACRAILLWPVFTSMTSKILNYKKCNKKPKSNPTSKVLSFLKQ